GVGLCEVRARSRFRSCFWEASGTAYGSSGDWGRPHLFYKALSTRWARNPPWTADDAFRARIRRRWRSYELWNRHRVCIPTSRHLRWEHPQGEKTGRPTRPASGKVCIGHQPTDCQGAGPGISAHAAGARRRGHRMIERRAFITLLGGAAAAWPLAARAQQPDRIPRIGVLMGVVESLPVYQANLGAFREGLQTLGWTDGRNVRIDTRWAAPGNVEALQRGAKELVAMQPDLILSHTTPTT